MEETVPLETLRAKVCSGTEKRTKICHRLFCNGLQKVCRQAAQEMVPHYAEHVQRAPPKRHNFLYAFPSGRSPASLSDLGLWT